MARPIKIEIVGDAKKFERAMGGVESKTGRLMGKVALVGKATAVAFGLAAGKIATDGVKLASDLGEAVDAGGRIFGEGFGKLEAGLKDSATAMGLNRGEATELANLYGILFKELTDAERATFALDATARAADIGSMLNEDSAVVAQAFTAAIAGSHETVRRFGITINEATIKQYALENGIGDVNGVLTENEKKLVRHGLIMQESADAAGNFEATSDSLANQQKIMGAQWEELQIKLGQKLLPVVVKVAGFFLNDVIPTFEKVATVLADKVGPVISAVVGWIRDDLIPIFQGADSTLKNDLGPTLDAFAKWWEDGVQPAIAAIVEIIREDLVPFLARIGAVIRDDVAPFVLNVLLPAFLEVSTFILGTLVPAFAKIVRFILRRVLPILATLVEFMFGTLIPAFAKVIRFIVNRVVPAFQRVADIITGVWRAARRAKDGIISVFNVVVSFVGRLPGRIRRAITGMWDSIKNQAINIKAAVIRTFNALVDNIRGIPGRIASAASGMWDGIKNSFKAAINVIIDGWNRLSFSVPRVSVPSWLGGGSFGGQTIGTPHIPRLATGTSSFAGGLARVGERGPETVSLPRGSRVTPNHLSRVSNGDVNVFVTTNADPFQVGTEVAWAIRTGSGI